MSRSIRFIFASIVAVACVSAEEFSIQLASPVASGNYQMKRSAFVFRTLGCGADTKPDVSATAEGTVDGRRRSMPLKVALSPNRDAFGIFREWPIEGVWIVSIKARCGSKTAGALVMTDAKGALVREGSVILNHLATEAEIENSLRTGKKPESHND